MERQDEREEEFAHLNTTISPLNSNGKESPHMERQSKSLNNSPPTSPRFQFTASLASPHTTAASSALSSDAKRQSTASAGRKKAGAWRASRMQQTQQATISTMGAPLTSATPDLKSNTDDSRRDSVDLSQSQRRIAAEEEGDSWEPWNDGRLNVSTPPGAVSELPSVSLRSPQSPDNVSAPWIAPQPKAPSAEYDWASFAYAYSRGKWDPSRLPQPPRQSNLYPGTEIRIGARDDQIVRPLSPERPEELEHSTVRRPSIDYVNPGPGSIQRHLSDSERRSSLAGLRAQHPATIVEHQKLNEVSPSATSLAANDTSLRAAGKDASTAEPTNATAFIDPFHVLQVASSSSAPQVGQAAALGDFAQRLINASNSQGSAAAPGGSKTDSVLATRSTLHRLPSDPTDYQSSVLSDSAMRPSKAMHSPASNDSSSPRTSSSAIAPVRPALAAQMSELAINSGYTSRGKDVLSGSNSPPSASTRPQPTPMQSIADAHDESDEGLRTERQQDGGDRGPAQDDGSKLVALSQGQQEDLDKIISSRANSSESNSEAFFKPPVKARQSTIPLFESNADQKNILSILPDNLQAAHTEVETQRRASMTTLAEMPMLLSRIGQSNSSPNLSTYIGLGRRIEGFYSEKGYLPALLPPDENERRQALRRYGPPRLRGDVNFERIAHLAKLVFNTKLVLITLVGEHTQFFQTEVGTKAYEYQTGWLQEVAAARDCSMCGHAILQQTDEPLVVLDTQRDWRFAGNPLVIGQPHIRFYAGGPLRTSDGFNLGTLCIIDDKPWSEFGPRQRHTLREFARVAMREMELIRDTIHLQTQDRMQHSIELFTRKCIEMESDEADEDKDHSQGLHKVYALAAKSMVDALKATGAVIFDLSHFELVVLDHSSTAHQSEEYSLDENGRLPPVTGAAAEYPDAVSLPPVQLQSDFAFSAASSPRMSNSTKATMEEKLVPPMAVLGACELLPPPSTRGDNVPSSHYTRIADFLRKHRTGAFFPYTPLPLRHMLPPGMSNVLLVPIFGLNRQPFALLCAYTRHAEGDTTLEDIKEFGLQYLRAKGTIILSAILKKDIMLADKAKSHFISNISHELRTPLHGILAAAELLAETKLNATQGSYLETVEACGKSLLELVNHVLDFTKLSGNMHATQSAVKPTQQCDLVKLVQEVCESSWIGQMAKNLESQQHAGIGSAYAKGSETSSTHSSSDHDSSDDRSRLATLSNNVETVIDVSMRPNGWLVNTDAGGIRRVLMNLIGNSLKFTTNGFVHVSLREIQSTDSHLLVELGVTDTGKGISRTFLEEQLFHPFTQENHLGPGTGLGLSIVNSIVQSPAINGKIDVWSTVGQGTEIRVTCELEISDPKQAEGPIYRPVLNVEHQRSITFLGFNEAQRGQSDLKDVLRSYYEDWWRFKYEDRIEDGDIILINDEHDLIKQVARLRSKPLPPIILLASARGSSKVAGICDEYQRKGGVVRLLFKPAGPAKLEAVTDFCLQCYERGRDGVPMLDASSTHSTPLPSPAAEAMDAAGRRDYFSTNEPSSANDDDAETPRGVSQPTATLSLPGQRTMPMRPKLSDEIRRNSHHISPGPPSANDAVLLRRHSSEGRSGKRQQQYHEASAIDEEAKDGDSIESNSTGGLGGLHGTYSNHAHNIVPLRAGEKNARPLMPTRSITYHEPRLQRHVLMSPLRSPHYRRADGLTNEAMDYFGPGASVTAGSSSFGSSLDVSSPSSPGSVISLEGGEGAVLRSAIHNAGLLRNQGSTPGQPAHLKRRLQVLSVEDNGINRRVLAAFFAKLDVDLVEATNGEEGVKVFEAYPPFHFDVIFMDLSMPVLDGIGAMTQIRKIEADRFRSEQNGTLAWLKATRNTASGMGGGGGTTPSGLSSSSSASGSRQSQPFALSSTALISTPGGTRPSAQARAKIFALTGRSSDDDKRRAFAKGADGFIVKPLSFKVLSSLIAKISAYR